MDFSFKLIIVTWTIIALCLMMSILGLLVSMIMHVIMPYLSDLTCVLLYIVVFYCVFKAFFFGFINPLFEKKLVGP